LRRCDDDGCALDIDGENPDGEFKAAFAVEACSMAALRCCCCCLTIASDNEFGPTLKTKKKQVNTVQ
jgi:hypothetical protein